jgi:two-component system, OmpR family, response regulator
MAHVMADGNYRYRGHHEASLRGVQMQSVHPQQAQQRILIVEDEADILSLMTFVLERAGYDVVCVTAVAQARAAISLYTFDAALVDLYLPDGRGDEVVGMLRAESPATRIVVTSAFSQSPLVPRFATEAGDTFLPKPFNNAALIAAVASRSSLTTARSA